jgi:hypothetical protein
MIGTLLPNAASLLAVLRHLLHRLKVRSALPAITGGTIKDAVCPFTLLPRMGLLPSVLKNGNGFQHSVNAHQLLPPLLHPHLLLLDIGGMVTETKTIGIAMEVKKIPRTTKAVVIRSDPLIAKLVLPNFALLVLTLVRSRTEIMSAWILPPSSNLAVVVYR